MRLPGPAGTSAGVADLPVPLSPLIGREAELAETGALVRGGVRLLVLTGPGGVGKTRLALELATRLRLDFAGGACFVSLVAIADADLVAAALAGAFGLREDDARPPWDRLTNHLRERRVLLVLDNFEQATDAATPLAALLGACPEVAAIVTSRAAVSVRGAHAFDVPPLGLPDPERPVTPVEIDRHAATAFFARRAGEVRPGFRVTDATAPAIAEICRRLDGLPLAIELAAARVAILPPPALLARLERRLPLLTDGPRDLPARQQTLRDAIAWSHDLLDPAEQRLFRTLAVFVGGCSLDAAQAVSREVGESGSRDETIPLDSPTPRLLDSLTALVGQSLLRQEEDAEGDPRYRMLETIREFGLERLAAAGEGEAVPVRRAHARWCLGLAERVGPHLHGSDQHRWARRLETDHANLRAALDWSVRTGDGEGALRLAGALWEFWWFGGHLREGGERLAAALALGHDAPAALRARALEGAGFLAHYGGDDDRAGPLLEESLARYREVGDRRGVAAALYTLGVTAEDRGDYGRAADLLGESATLAAERGDRRGEAFARLHLGIVAYGRGDLSGATAHAEAGIALARELGSNLGAVLGALCLALVADARGQTRRVAQHCREIVAWHDASGVFAGAWPRRSIDAVGPMLGLVATLAVGTGEAERAARLFGAAAAEHEAIGSAPALPERARFEAAAVAARARLGDAAFDAATAMGRTMTSVQARADLEATLVAAEAGTGPTAEKGADPFGLSPREREVLRLLAEGLPDREIAARLSISPHTAMRHVANIFTKLDVNTRAAAGACAHRHGLA